MNKIKSKVKWNIIISSGAAVSGLCSCGFFTLYHKIGGSVLHGLMIFCMVFCFEIVIRFLNGQIINLLFHNRLNYKKKWFAEKPKEQKLYERLKVKKWKNRMPTYDNRLFSLKGHKVEEIILASCQSEIFHEVNMVLGFTVLVFRRFIATNLWIAIALPVFAAIFDCMLAIMQRYNRPRLIKLTASYFPRQPHFV